MSSLPLLVTLVLAVNNISPTASFQPSAPARLRCAFTKHNFVGGRKGTSPCRHPLSVSSDAALSLSDSLSSSATTAISQQIATPADSVAQANLTSSVDSATATIITAESSSCSDAAAEIPEEEELVFAVEETSALQKHPSPAPVRRTRRHSKWRRLVQALPGTKRAAGAKSENLDKTILSTAIPSMINLAVVPIVNSVDTFWVGRMGIALALAGQAAANQAFFTLYFLVNYLPTITAPLVAKAVGSGNHEEAKQRVCESLFLGNVLGGLVTIFLVGFPRTALGMVLEGGAPAMEYAAPYLRLRALSMVPTIIAATGFAAYRGLLDTVTPLKVNLAANLLNLVLDPLLMFGSSMGFVGAALATALSETTAGFTYLRLLLKKKLATIPLLLKPPSLKSLMPLLQGGLTMLGRQIALNFGFLSAARCAQRMDPTGVSAAAYGIVMQIYSVGIVVQVAMQGTAAALVPSTLANSGKSNARRVADRMFAWGTIVGLLLGVSQLVALPWLVPIFSTLPEVQQAVWRPAFLASLLHAINGFVFVGEGTMLGLGSYRDLMLITAGSIAAFVATLFSPLGKSLEGILLGQMVFTGIQALGVVGHYLRFGPLAVRRMKKDENLQMVAN